MTACEYVLADDVKGRPADDGTNAGRSGNGPGYDPGGGTGWPLLAGKIWTPFGVISSLMKTCNSVAGGQCCGY
jgi:hypothetical protein